MMNRDEMRAFIREGFEKGAREMLDPDVSWPAIPNFGKIASVVVVGSQLRLELVSPPPDYIVLDITFGNEALTEVEPQKL